MSPFFASGHPMPVQSLPGHPQAAAHSNQQAPPGSVFQVPAAPFPVPPPASAVQAPIPAPVPFAPFQAPAPAMMPSMQGGQPTAQVPTPGAVFVPSAVPPPQTPMHAPMMLIPVLHPTSAHPSLPPPAVPQAQPAPMAFVPHGHGSVPSAGAVASACPPPAYHAHHPALSAATPMTFHAPPPTVAPVPAMPAPFPHPAFAPALPPTSTAANHQVVPTTDFSKEKELSPVDESEATQLLVNYVADNTLTRELEAVFEPFGPLDLVRIIKDKNSGASKGYAFVYFTNPGDAAAACRSLAALPGGGCIVGSKRIKVSFASPQRPLSRRALSRVAHRARKIQLSQLRAMADAASTGTSPGPTEADGTSTHDVTNVSSAVSFDETMFE